MSYLVLARKFRPQNFSDVAGQDHIRRVLRNSLRRGKVAHAYIFSGPRGVGKTSLARIFAKSLNCQDLNEGEPCLKCSNCQEISQGISMAVREVDGASNNSVENVRELIDSFRALPPPGSKYKIYIIDEVHMLSTSAFNALLKSLEEPPPNTVFILATTEVHKIPETVISRCQRHDFRSIDIETIEKTLDQIISVEGRKAEKGVTRLIARYSDGSLRDSQSLLERIMAYCENENDEIGVEAARQILGVAGPMQIERIWQAVHDEDAEAALRLLNEVFRSGVDTARFLREFVEAVREQFQTAVSSRSSSPAQILELEHLLSLAARGADGALRSAFSEPALESLVVRLCLRKLRERQPTAPGSPSGGPLNGRKTDKGVSSSKVVEMQPKSDSIRNSSSEKDQADSVAEDAAMPSTEQLGWGAFLSRDGILSQPILLQHLKRMEVKNFVHGEISMGGPEFSVDYLQKADNLVRFRQELERFSPGKPAQAWKINISRQPATSSSVYDLEIAASKEKVAQKHKAALEHPSVKRLQSLFPGSNVAIKR